MIPKIIHYSWFSGEEMPDAFVQMMVSWKKFLPDYEFRLWDRNALDEANIMFANEAVCVRKWAFAADAIRIYAVYHYGGIWLDGDVMVYKSFDPFLNCRMFIGKEIATEFQHSGKFVTMNLLTSHCFGAEKGHPFLKDCLDYYENRHFILSENENLPQGLRYDMRLLPSIQALLASKYGYYGCILDSEKIEILQEDIHVYPSQFFDSPRYHSMDEVVCIHFQFGSWLPLHNGRVNMADICKYSRPRKKDFYYYVFQWVNKILARKGLQIKVISV